MFLAYFANLLEKVDNALHVFLDEQISLVRHNAFLRYYYQQVKNFLFSGGKRLRPILMTVTYDAIKPNNIRKDILTVALSLELLHNASLIHDDIMDNAEIRRGEKTFHRIFSDYAKDNDNLAIENFDDYGVAMGILGGDFVYNLAYKAVNTKDFPAEVALKAAIEFNEGFLKIAQGVIIETDLMRRFDVTEEEYLQMIELKTAALFEKATRMGAIYANGTEKQIDLLGKFGLTAGLAFQIVDDIIGTFGDSNKTGKPNDSDLKEGKKTILLIKAIERANDEQRDTLSKTVGNRNATDSEIEKVRDVFRKTGSLEYASLKAEELFQQCIEYLEMQETAINEKQKNHLIEIASMGIHREK
jgi:geranylgeranyl diphosphate synthase type I